MNDDEFRVPQGYRVYPRLAKHCLTMPPTGTVLEELFSDPGERARAANAMTQVTTEVLLAYMPEVFRSHVVGTPFWQVLCESISETAVRTLALGVYLGQTGVARLKLEEPNG